MKNSTNEMRKKKVKANFQSLKKLIEDSGGSIDHLHVVPTDHGNSLIASNHIKVIFLYIERHNFN